MCSSDRQLIICGVCNYIQRTMNKLWQRIWLSVKSVTTPRSSSTKFEIETSVILVCHFIHPYSFSYPLLGTFVNEVIFRVISEYYRPFCKPWHVWLLWRKINSCVVCRIWYTCQICVVGRNYILQRRSILQVTWKSLPTPSKKTKKINIQISR